MMRIAYWATLIVLGTSPTVFGQGAEMHVTQTIAGTGFTGAPYSAKETAVNVRTSADGVKYSTTYVTLLWRDAAGRTREEQLGKSPTGVDTHFVIVLDPVAGISLRWLVIGDSGKKVVTISALSDRQRVTEPVSSRFGLPSANPANPSPASASYACADCTVKSEFFPARQINGVNAVGLRTTRTYKAGTMDNGQDFVGTNIDETWTSPDLRINVLSINDRTEYGKTTINVTDIVPGGKDDPALFQAPAGYQVRDKSGTTTQSGVSGGAGQTVVNALNGTWVSVDPGTAAFAQIAIDGSNVHPFGACNPRPCDWGILEGKIFAASVRSSGVAAMTAQMNTTFSEVTLTLILEADGRLRVDDFTRFTDGSKRADYHHVDYLTREHSAGQPAAAVPTIVANALDGSWINVDPRTRGLVQITIDGLNVHPFGACHPNPCDWGIVEGKIFAAGVDSQSVAAMTAQKVTTFSVTTLILILEADGRLRVDDLTHFTDGSNRSDYHSVEYLTREHSAGQPAATAPPAPARGNRAAAAWSQMWTADTLIPRASYAVQGAPFEALVEENRIPADSGQENIRRFVRVLRDGHGRQRYENLADADCAGCKAVPTDAAVIDVVAHRSIRLDPANKTAVSCPMQSTSSPVRVPASELSDQASTPSAPGRWLRRLIGQCGSSSGEATPRIAGLQATVTRIPHENSTGQTADAQQPRVVDELWTSPLYRMPVKRVIDDPGFGHIELQVVRFKAGEPHASEFEIPNGYTVRTEADDACGTKWLSAASRQ